MQYYDKIALLFANCNGVSNSLCILLEILYIHIFRTGVVSLTSHGIGKEAGTAVTGYLFSTVGTIATLCGYAAATLVLLVIFLIYILVEKDPAEGYKKVPEVVDPKDEEEKVELNE